MKKEKEKNRKAPFITVIKDTLFALKLSFKYAPFACIVMLLSYLLDSVMYFITGTYALKYIIDSFEQGGISLENVAKTVLLMVLIPTIIQLVVDTIVDFAWNVGSIKIEVAINKMVFEKNTQVELSCFENPDFYDKYVKASADITTNVFSITYTVFFFFYTILNTCLYGSVLFTLDPVFIIFAIIPLFGSFFKKKSNELWHKHLTEDKVLHRRCQYTQRVFYSNEYAKEMRLTNAKSFMLKRYDEASDGRMNVVKKYGKKEMLLDILGNKISSILANPLAIAYAVFSALVGVPWGAPLGLGGCAIVINSVSELSNSFIQITNQYYRLHEKSLFVEDFREFIGYEPQIKENPDGIVPQVGTIKFENVSFKYFGSEEYVLKNINLELKSNEKIALVGHNGAGKSTLVKLLLRLYDVTEGRITLNGVDIRELRTKEYRNLFSVVFQDFKQIALPVSENVLMRPFEEGDEEKIIEALKLSGVYNRIMELKDGYNTVLTKEFSEDGAVLSVGEGQKLAIAHAFLKNSPYIVLDEPTSALDPVAESQMYNNMMSIGQGKGMVFISHRLSSAVSADKIYMLDGGEVIESGSHLELMARCGKYADMFNKQAQNYVDIEGGDVDEE
ncbi:MAG: ABC transporter ATP-binding protein [Clostridia bacterium]|nr:ABC transporter ATP-binding protein [Clostridia bacterium]